METNPITRLAVGLLVILGVVFGYRILHPATTFAAEGVDAYWDAAVQRSRDANEPALVIFTAGWCPACRQLHAAVLSRSDVQEELGHYVCYTVDLTNSSAEDAAKAHKFGVSGIPALIRYDSQGKETDRVHYLPPPEMIAWLKAGE